MTINTDVLWAQRSSAEDAEKNVVFITINAPDADASSVKFAVEGNKLTFAASAKDKQYNVELDLYDAASIDKQTYTGKSLVAVLKKDKLDEAYWPRLTKEKLKASFIKTDFEKWADEDEQDEPVNLPDFGDAGAMGGMPGMGMGGGGGGMGNVDFEKLMAQMQAENPGGFGDEGEEPEEAEADAEEVKDEAAPSTSGTN